MSAHRGFRGLVVAILFGSPILDGCTTPAPTPAKVECTPGAADSQASELEDISDTGTTPAADADSSSPPNTSDTTPRTYPDVDPAFKVPGPVPGMTLTDQAIGLPCSEATDLLAQTFGGLEAAECGLIDDSQPWPEYDAAYSTHAPGIIRTVRSGTPELAYPNCEGTFQPVRMSGLVPTKTGLREVWNLKAHKSWFGYGFNHDQNPAIVASDTDSNLTLMLREEVEARPWCDFNDGTNGYGGIQSLYVIRDLLTNPTVVAKYSEPSSVMDHAGPGGECLFTKGQFLYGKRWISSSMVGGPDLFDSPVHILRADASLQGWLGWIGASQKANDGPGCGKFGSTGDGTVWRAHGGHFSDQGVINVQVARSPWKTASADEFESASYSLTALRDDGSVSELIRVPLVSKDRWLFSQNAKDFLPGIAAGWPQIVLVDPKTTAYTGWTLPDPPWNQTYNIWSERLKAPPDWGLVDNQQRIWLGFTLDQFQAPPENWTEAVALYSGQGKQSATLAWGKTKHIPELRVAIWRPGVSVEWRRYPWPSCGYTVPGAFDTGCKGVRAEVQELGPHVRFTWSVNWICESNDPSGGCAQIVEGVPGLPWYPPKPGKGTVASSWAPRSFTRILTWDAFYKAGQPILK